MNARQIRLVTRLAASAAVGTLLVSAVGCSSTGISSLRRDPTPELLTSVESPTESANSWAITKNLNFRMMLDDAARVIYINRPSRLSPAPIPD